MTIRDMFNCCDNIHNSATIEVYDDFGNYLDRECPIICGTYDKFVENELDLKVRHFQVIGNGDRVIVYVK